MDRASVGGCKTRTPSSLMFQIMLTTERVIIRVNRVISFIYFLLITGLLTSIFYIYTTKLNGLVFTHAAHQRYAIFHTAVSIYFLISVTANYILCLTTEPSQPPSAVYNSIQIRAHHDTENPPSCAIPLPSPSPTTATVTESWRMCTVCDAAKPPRTHHCSTCNACYIRLCHHCPALGRCVARDNYPYFFRFVSGASLGCLFASLTCYWLSTHEATSQLLVMVTICGGAISLSTGFLTAWHVYLASTAQTTIEWMESWSVRRRGDAPSEWGWFGGPFTQSLKANIKDSMGDPTWTWTWLPWWSVFLFPFPKVPIVTPSRKTSHGHV